ncbi:hypothetical protein GJU94_13815 [Brucella sp. 10RB9214]|uniref:hypothetical protein n=1 Tax=unclassified Brucella TaxID=2632610 RepID=UPI000972B83D|nr:MULTISPECIES: hypothetical protein [unclassified Brucella]APY14282.1 hypothetical protein BKD02_08400 [Brucella sp. 09RB8910]MRN45432.1 hypothetical protein [Brucella sp. 10RB9212]MRN50891.1 hypothetical protein [Brucella sp. 10RB9214]
MNRALLEMLADDEFETETDAPKAGNVEPMRRPDYRAKKHGRPQPWLRYAAREAVEMTVVVAFCVAVCGFGLGMA